jgi:hypothetical protein
MKLRSLVEKTAQVMNFSDVIKKENPTARIPRIIPNIHFEPHAPAVGSVQVNRNLGPFLCRFFDQRLQLNRVFGTQTKHIAPRHVHPLGVGRGKQLPRRCVEKHNMAVFIGHGRPDMQFIEDCPQIIAAFFDLAEHFPELGVGELARGDVSLD